MSAPTYSILIVEDTADLRELLAYRIEHLGYQVTPAENGRQALELLQNQKFDLMLLDIMMPEMNGYQVLEHIRDDPNFKNLPVIVVSAVNDMDSVVKCIELGAEDYLPKPFKVGLLKARLAASLEKKRLRDQEKFILELIRQEREKSEQLLHNILPPPIAERLKQGATIIADKYEAVTVLFADLVDFTEFSAHFTPEDTIALLNRTFSRFDSLLLQYGLEKIKTIGDAYMVVGGVPTPRPDHAEAVADMALALQAAAKDLLLPTGEAIRLRIGMHSGPVTAGVIGSQKFAYDLWGDTVNTASRMESHGLPGTIQVSEATYNLLKDKYLLSARGPIEVKGKGLMPTYLLEGKKG